MSKNTEKPQNSGEKMSFRPVAQYIKDLSFECPTAPTETQGGKQDLNLNLGVQVAPAERENQHEVRLLLKAEAKGEQGKTLFMIEMAYVGVYEVVGVAEEQLNALLNIDGAALIFPFARQIFVSTVSAGGYRPPLLEPINFHALYLQSQQQLAEEQKKAAS